MLTLLCEFDKFDYFKRRKVDPDPPSPDPHMCMYNTPEIHFHDVYYITYSTSSNSPGKHNTVHLSVTMVTVTFNVGYKIYTKEVPRFKEKENVSFKSFSFY